MTTTNILSLSSRLQYLNLPLFVVRVYTRTTWYSKSKTIPRHFFARKFFFKQIWTQHQEFEIGSTNPPPPLDMGILDFSKFGLSIKSWKLVPPTSPLPLDMGILDFNKFGLSIKSWKLVPPTPPPPLDMGILDFSKFGLSIKSWKLVPPTLPPPPNRTWEFGILAKFGLS